MVRNKEITPFIIILISRYLEPDLDLDLAMVAHAWKQKTWKVEAEEFLMI